MIQTRSIDMYHIYKNNQLITEINMDPKYYNPELDLLWVLASNNIDFVDCTLKDQFYIKCPFTNSELHFRHNRLSMFKSKDICKLYNDSGYLISAKSPNTSDAVLYHVLTHNRISGATYQPDTLSSGTGEHRWDNHSDNDIILDVSAAQQPVKKKRVFSQEAKDKMSLAKKGKKRAPRTAEHSARISAAKKLSNERRKIGGQGNE